MCGIRKIVSMILFAKQNRDTDIENVWILRVVGSGDELGDWE